MIAACPGCGARYRVDSSRVGPRGARVRCGRCEEIFRVEAADHRARHFLVADADDERAKQIAASLSESGVRVSVVHDGVEALLNILRAAPSVAILDETLPRISGRALCDVLKRDPVLSQIHVVLGVTEEGVVATATGDAEPDSIVSWDDLEGWLAKRLKETAPKSEREGDDSRTDPLVARGLHRRERRSRERKGQRGTAGSDRRIGHRSLRSGALRSGGSGRSTHGGARGRTSRGPSPPRAENRFPRSRRTGFPGG